MKINIARVQDLKLHRAPAQEILDLGCGGGFFLFVCREVGHHGLGLDREGPSLYTELIDLFGVERRIWEINAFEPLPNLGRKFDWITGFSTAFNREPDRSLWGPRQWLFFLNDLKTHLRPGGKIFFALNPAQKGWYYTDELHDFFIEQGAMVERERIFFPGVETST